MPDYEKYFKINAMGKSKLDVVTRAENIIFDKNNEQNQITNTNTSYLLIAGIFYYGFNIWYAMAVFLQA